jgi:hypothetical protein
MSSGWSRLLFALLIAASLTSLRCGDDPPEKEMEQAQGAIAAARAAGADEYAHDEIAAAELALKNARAAVEQRDYRLALNNALESRERAQNAAKEAADQKAAARAAAERAMTEIAGALVQARAKLKAADAVHASTRLLDEARDRIHDSEEALQKARATVARGEYRDVAKALSETMASLTATTRDLDSATAAAARRRH